MTLVVQTVIVVAVLVLTVAWLRFLSPGAAGPARAIVAVTAVLAVAIAAANWWGGTHQLLNEARTDRHVSSAQASVAGAAGAGARADFLTWAASRIPQRSSYYLLEGPNVVLWATYQLLPRLAVAVPQQAQWIVLYGSRLSAAGPAARLFGPVQSFAPGFGIATRR